jgi:hypothetical protein
VLTRNYTATTLNLKSKSKITFLLTNDRQIREYDVGHVITCMSFLEDGCTIALGTASGTVMIYNLKSDAKPLLTVLVNERFPVTALGFQVKISKPASIKSSPTKSTSPRKEPTNNQEIRQFLQTDTLNLTKQQDPISPPSSIRDHETDVFSPIKSKKPTQAFPTIDVLRMQAQAKPPPPAYEPPSAPQVTRAPLTSSQFLRSPASDDGLEAFSPLNKQVQQPPPVSYNFRTSTVSISPIEKTNAASMDVEEDEIFPNLKAEIQQEPSQYDYDRMDHDKAPMSSLQFNFMDALDKPKSPPPQETNVSRNEPLTSPVRSFQSRLQQGMLEDIVMSLQATLHNDIRNMHLDMLQQFHYQRETANEQIQALKEQVQTLTQEVQTLREDIKRKNV